MRPTKKFRLLGSGISISAALAIAVSAASSGSAVAASGGGSKAGADAAACPQAVAAQKVLTPMEKPPTQIAVSTPIKHAPRHKTAVIVEFDAPTSVASAKGIQQAARLLHWKVTVVQTDATPANVQAAWTRAVQLKPNVVFAVGTDPNVIKTQAAELAKGGTKLVSYALGDQQSLKPGATVAPFSYETEGDYALDHWMQLAADQIVVSADCKPATVAPMFMSAYQTQANMLGAFKRELAAQCPKCTIAPTTWVNPADIGTKFPGEVVSYLQRSPSTNYLVLGYSPMLTGVAQAVQAAGVGTSLKGVLTDSGEIPQFGSMGPHSFETFDIAKNDVELGWQLFDAALRLEAGQPAPVGVEPYQTPLFLVTPQDIGRFRASGYTFNPHFRAQYETLWGLK